MHVDGPDWQAALGEIARYTRETYDPLGVVVGGSLVRGEGGPTSDLDVVVVHRCPWRLREQRWFGGLPAELFVNPLATLRRSFAQDHAAARPIMAHLLAHGRVLPGADPEVEALVEEARAWWAREPPPWDAVAGRYRVVDLLDDARDLHGRDPAGELALLTQALEALATHVVRSAGGWTPRRKTALRALAARDPRSAELVAAFAVAPAEERLALATALARHVIGVDTFFSWRSAPDPQEP